MKQTFRLSCELARRNACLAVRQAPPGHTVTISAGSRNSEQNALLWVYLTAFSEQLRWPVNGELAQLTPDEWKDILSAGYRRYNPRISQGIDGGVVMLGLRTSKMKKDEFSDFLDFIGAVASDRGVDLEPNIRRHVTGA